MKVTELIYLIGKPNAYYSKLAKPLGGVSVAVLFSQLFYWQDKATSHLGVYKTRDELEEETGLTHNEQRTAIKKLCEKGILIVTEKRLEHRTFYKIDNEKLNKVLLDFAKSNDYLSRSSQSHHPELDKIASEMIRKSSSLDQEITTKTTTEITTDIVINKQTQKTKRGCQLPEDFRPNTHHLEIALTENVDLEMEFTKFKDYCLANGKKYLDWSAAFNNWLRNAGRYKKSNNQFIPTKFMTLAERNKAILESMRSNYDKNNR